MVLPEFAAHGIAGFQVSGIRSQFKGSKRITDSLHQIADKASIPIGNSFPADVLQGFREETDFEKTRRAFGKSIRSARGGAGGLWPKHHEPARRVPSCPGEEGSIPCFGIDYFTRTLDSLIFLNRSEAASVSTYM